MQEQISFLSKVKNKSLTRGDECAVVSLKNHCEADSKILAIEPGVDAHGIL